MDREERFHALMVKSRQKYIIELSEKIQQVMLDYFLLVLEKKEDKKNNITRFFHSIKGTSSTLGFLDLSNAGNKYEIFMNSIQDLKVLSDEVLSEISRGIGHIYREYDKLKSVYSSEDDAKIEMIEANNYSQQDDSKNINQSDGCNINELYNNCKINKLNNDCNTTENNFQQRGLKILLVEDNLKYINLLREIFNKDNEEVLVENELLSIEKLAIQDEKVDVIIINLMQSNYSGFRIYDYLREHKIEIPVVFYSDNEIVVELMEIMNLERIEVPFLRDEVRKFVFNIAYQGKSKVLKNEITNLTKTVLAVDDENVMLELISKSLQEEGFRVIKTTNPHRVIELIYAEKIDLILLDVLMVERNGYEVYRELRDNGINIPVVFITSMDIAREAITDPMLDYIKKPFKVERIADKVNFMLEKSIKCKILQDGNINNNELNNDNELNNNNKMNNTDLNNNKFNNDKDLNEDRVLKDDKNTNNGKNDGNIHFIKDSENKGIITKVALNRIAKYRILVIDDESIIVNLISHGISNPSYEIKSNTNGEDGLKEAFLWSPDLAIIDLMLPKVDGFEVCRRLKNNDGTKKTKIIVVSSKRREEDIIRCFELGVDDYIMKPFNLSELEMRVKRILNLKR